MMLVVSLVLVFAQWINYGVAVEVAESGADPPEKTRVFPFQCPKLNSSNVSYASELGLLEAWYQSLVSLRLSSNGLE